MFTFLNREPIIHVDCFTYDASVYEFTPIVKTSKTVPKWWNNLNPFQPKFSFDDLNNKPRSEVNMRNCFGFVELYKKGVVLENWTDISIKTTKQDYRYFYRSGLQPEEHSRSEYGEGFRNYHHIKLCSPWIMKEKTGVQFLFLGAEWCLEDYDFKVPPGVLQFDFNVGTNVNIMLPAKENEYQIPIGFPLAHIIPLSEKRFSFKNHLVSENEFKNLKVHSSASFKGWRSITRLVKRNKDREKAKCPFH